MKTLVADKESFISFYRWPLSIVAFFILLTIYHIWLATTAFNQRPAKVTEHPYLESLQYESRIQEINTAKEISLSVAIEVAPSHRSMSLSFASSGSYTPQDISSVDLYITKPNTTKLDQTILLTQDDTKLDRFYANGIFPPGLYSLQIRVTFKNGKSALIQRTHMIQ
ncbi:MAG: FixH family protein [Bdellovibrionales bacterium]|nr:FixH family protein [Bdellovibrionales bacterium]